MASSEATFEWHHIQALKTAAKEIKCRADRVRMVEAFVSYLNGGRVRILTDADAEDITRDVLGEVKGKAAKAAEVLDLSVL